MEHTYKKIIDNVYWVGVVDYKLKVFDIIMETEYGTTYNSYLVKGSDKTVLIDTAKSTFKDEFFDRIKSVARIEDIDYLVMNHTEPDHSGLIKDLLEINPDLEIFATGPALMNIKEIINTSFKSTKVTNGMTLSLGDKTLEFYIQPNLHWPDTMFTLLKEDEFLFTCDFFGAHYASDEIMFEKCKHQDVYKIALKEYFEAIMHPFLPSVRKGLDTVRKINPKYIGVSHGLTFNSEDVLEFVELYDEWSVLPEKPEKPLVLIPYATAYGYTEKMVKIIKDTLKEEFNNEITVKTYDLIFANRKEIIDQVPICDAFLIGSSTIVRDTVKVVWELLAEINYEMARGKIASAFGSYGWSGEAVPNILQREKQLLFKVLDEGLRIKFNPSDDQIEEIKDYARKIAEMIKKK